MNEVVLSSQNELYLSPIVGMEEAKHRYEGVRQFAASVLKKDTDYGTVAGIGKPTLLKPGAEKLCSFFGLSAKFTPVESVKNWTGSGNPDNEPFFYFEFRCDLYRGENFIASCNASCNSWEKKYRYRKDEKVCPVCGKSGTIIKGKKEYGGGWVCLAKKGGCGSKWKDGDPVIEKQAVGIVKNFDTAEQVNTFQKMAQKRSFVGATLVACNVSEYFTQDVEDMSDTNQTNDTEPWTPIDVMEANPEQPEQEAPVQQNESQKRSKPPYPGDEILLQTFELPADFTTILTPEAAENYCDRNGEPYGHKDCKTLFYMLDAIEQRFVTNHLTQDEKDGLNDKKAAIYLIFKTRREQAGY